MELIEWILREENLEQAIYNLICENKHLTVEQVMAEFVFQGQQYFETMLR